MKKKLKINSGICPLAKALAFKETIENDGKPFISNEEWAFFHIILIEEGKKFGGYVESATLCYFWPEGKLKPRLKTIREMIKRIENS